MGCRELQIQNYFSFSDNEKLSENDFSFVRESDFSSSQIKRKKVAYSRFSHNLFFPIREKGGANLYAMVQNDPVSWWDYLGLSGVEDCTIQIYAGHGDEVTKWLTDIKQDEKRKNAVIDKKNRKIERQNDRNPDAPPRAPIQSSRQRGLMAVCCVPDSQNTGSIPAEFRDPGAEGLFGPNEEKGLPDLLLHNGPIDNSLPDYNMVAAVERAIAQARERALTLCNQPPACCKQIDIIVKCGSRINAIPSGIMKSAKQLLGKLCGKQPPVICPESCPSESSQ